jgi:hypothetical protein
MRYLIGASILALRESTAWQVMKQVCCAACKARPLCKNVLDAFRSIDPSLSLNSASNDLFALGPYYLAPHIRFTLQISCWVGLLVRKALGKNTTAFSMLDPIATAEFVVRKGTAVGFVLNNVIDDVGVQRSGSVGKTSEVWFVKQE